MKNVAVVLGGVLLLCSFSAAAEGLSYSYLQGSYVMAEPDQGAESDGWGAALSLLVAPGVYVLGSYSITETDDVDSGPGEGTVEASGFRAGLGWRSPISQVADLVSEIAYLQAESKPKGTAVEPASDENGYSAAFGLRYLLAQNLEANGRIDYVDIGASQETSFGLGLAFRLMKSFALVGDYGFGGDVNGWSAGARLEF